jgi:hypothetical protein
MLDLFLRNCDCLCFCFRQNSIFFVASISRYLRLYLFQRQIPSYISTLKQQARLSINISPVNYVLPREHQKRANGIDDSADNRSASWDLLIDECCTFLINANRSAQNPVPVLRVFQQQVLSTNYLAFE